MNLLELARQTRPYIEKAAQSLPSMPACNLLVTISVYGGWYGTEKLYGDRYNLEFYCSLIYKIHKEGKRWRIF